MNERDRFFERMKLIKKYVREKEVKMIQKNEQREWMKSLKDLVSIMNEEEKSRDKEMGIEEEMIEERKGGLKGMEKDGRNEEKYEEIMKKEECVIKELECVMCKENSVYGEEWGKSIGKECVTKEKEGCKLCLRCDENLKNENELKRHVEKVHEDEEVRSKSGGVLYLVKAQLSKGKVMKKRE